jgi:hypothetical protein
MFILFRLYGSALPRACVVGVLAGVLAGVLQATVADEIREKWRHPYPYQAFAFVLGFMLIIRCAGRTMRLACEARAQLGSRAGCSALPTS